MGQIKELNLSLGLFSKQILIDNVLETMCKIV